MRSECHCPVCGGSLPEMPVTLHPERGIVVAGGAFVAMTAAEMGVLEALAEAYPNVVRKERIMDALYGLSGDEPNIKIVDVYICKIRKKTERIGVRIDTSWGQGYSLGSMPKAPEIRRSDND